MQERQSNHIQQNNTETHSLTQPHPHADTLHFIYSLSQTLRNGQSQSINTHIHYDIRIIIQMSIAPPKNPPHAGCIGQWVSTRDFIGRKSFGYFQCNYCEKSWTSAHTTKGYKQACKQCQRSFFPAYMWQNEPGSYEDEDNDLDDDYLDEDKPHRSDLCQACQQGVCLESVGRSRNRPNRRWS